MKKIKNKTKDLKCLKYMYLGDNEVDIKRNFESLMLEFINNSNIPKEVLEDMYFNNKRYDNCKLKIIQNKNITDNIVLSFLNMSNLDGDNGIYRTNILDSDNLTPEEFKDLYYDSKLNNPFHSDNHFLFNKNIPTEILLSIYDKYSKDINKFVLDEKGFYKKKNSDVLGDTTYVDILKHPKFPVDLINKLMDGDDYNNQINRAMGMENPNISKELLIKYSKDQNEYVRFNIAKNINTPQEVLDELRKEDDIHIKIAIAKNINTSCETLKAMIIDLLNLDNDLNDLNNTDNINASSIKLLINNDYYGVPDKRIYLIEKLLCNPNLTKDEVFCNKLFCKYFNTLNHIVYTYDNYEYCMKINPTYEYIFKGFCTNPNASKGILNKIDYLCKKFKYLSDLRRLCYDNKNIDKSIILKVFSNEISYDDNFVYYYAASNPVLNSDDLLDILYNTDNFDTICGIASNPNIDDRVAYAIYYLINYIIDKYELNIYMS